MATYSELQTRVIDLINRTDCTTALAKQFIQDAQRKAQRGLRLPSLDKVMQIVVGTTTTTQYNSTSGVAIIPNDFIEMIYVYTSQGVLNRVPLTRFIELNSELATTGNPRYYTRIQNTFHLKPIPTAGTEIDIVYQGEDDVLTADTSSNTFSTVAPDLLIYGACVYAADYFNDERKATFQAMYDGIYQDITNLVTDAESLTVDAQVQPSIQFELDIIN
jgi:hypothetical protein